MNPSNTLALYIFLVLTRSADTAEEQEEQKQIEQEELNKSAILKRLIETDFVPMKRPPLEFFLDQDEKKNRFPLSIVKQILLCTEEEFTSYNGMYWQSRWETPANREEWVKDTLLIIY